MPNERLRAAITASSYSLAAVSEHAGVDRKTVERWISTERVPHQRHRLAVAQLLREDDAILWPSILETESTKRTSEAEFVAIYPSRSALPTDTWCSLLDNAQTAIDLLAFAGTFLHDSLPDFASRLSMAAQRGAMVRLLFGDPSSDAVVLRGAEEGIGDLLTARCRLTWRYLHGVLTGPGIDARRHGTTLYSSLFRFDDTLIVNPHTLGAAASQSPLIHLRRIDGGRLFPHQMAGFERAWQDAEPVDMPPAGPGLLR
jgi:lambda repressor-like predicted transcriptional regulator